MVEIPPPNDRCRVHDAVRAWHGRSWATLSAARSTMKNFVRLVRFAWPYRVRFGLSLGCAVMVALFCFTELGAVLPLLKILFNSENCQTLDRREDRRDRGPRSSLLDAQARRGRADHARRRVGDPAGAASSRRTSSELDDELEPARARRRERQQLVDLPGPQGLSRAVRPAGAGRARRPAARAAASPRPASTS